MEQRSTSRSIDAGTAEGGGGEDALVVGEIRGPHGLRGDVRIDPRTDIPGRFAKGATLLCDDVGPLTIASVRGDMAQPIVRFKEIASRADAERLVGHLLRVPRDRSRGALAQGSFLWADLVGSVVMTPEGASLGTVRDLLRAGATDVLVVSADGSSELLLPMVDSVVRSVDVAARRIVAVPQEELQ